MDDEVYMLTTEDNPYSPFTQWDLWQAYDHAFGYYTNEYLARIADTSPMFDVDLNLKIIHEAIDEIVNLNCLGIYRKVKESDYEGEHPKFVAKQVS